MQQGIFESAAFSFWLYRHAERSKNVHGEKPKCGAILTQRRSQLFMLRKDDGLVLEVSLSDPMQRFP